MYHFKDYIIFSTRSNYEKQLHKIRCKNEVLNCFALLKTASKAT